MEISQSCFLTADFSITFRLIEFHYRFSVPFDPLPQLLTFVFFAFAHFLVKIAIRSHFGSRLKLVFILCSASHGATGGMQRFGDADIFTFGCHLHVLQHVGASLHQPSRAALTDWPKFNWKYGRLQK